MAEETGTSESLDDFFEAIPMPENCFRGTFRLREHPVYPTFSREELTQIRKEYETKYGRPLPTAYK